MFALAVWQGDPYYHKLDFLCCVQPWDLVYNLLTYFLGAKLFSLMFSPWSSLLFYLPIYICQTCLNLFSMGQIVLPYVQPFVLPFILSPYIYLPNFPWAKFDSLVSSSSISHLVFFPDSPGRICLSFAYSPELFQVFSSSFFRDKFDSLVSSPGISHMACLPFFSGPNCPPLCPALGSPRISDEADSRPGNWTYRWQHKDALLCHLNIFINEEIIQPEEKGF